MSFISTKSIPVRERLIMALDVPSIPEAQTLVEELGDSVIFTKSAWSCSCRVIILVLLNG